MESPLNDLLWDKFDLADATCGVASNDMDFDLDAIMDETFADLENFAQGFTMQDDEVLAESLITDASDMLMIKAETEEVFFEEEALQTQTETTDYDFLNDFNIHTLDASTSELETIKSDCMWSSTLNHLTESPHNYQSRGRKRDVSLTLSECAEGTMVLKDIELLGNTHNGLEGLHAYLETPLATSESDTESASTDEDIDVVTSDDSVGAFSLSQQHHNAHHHHHKKPARIEPGRSLLLSRNRLAHHNQEPQQTYAQHQTFMDHSYFSVQPPSPVAPSLRNIHGLLTPTESSDDDETFTTRLQNGKLGAVASNGIDKRKIVDAVHSLMKKNKQSLVSSSGKKVAIPDNIKFKFRMKFKSNTPKKSVLAINHNRHQERRKTLLRSASSAQQVKQPESKPHSRSSAQQPTSLLATPIPSPSRISHQSSSSTSSASSSTSSKSVRSPGSSHSNRSGSNQEQKCREIRDLHNSMERQRRVDLRKNFDRLKSVVPELADMEKASKLNILNKASEYCHQLSNQDAKLKKEVERETARNLLLKKKLQGFQNFFNNGVRLSSGRISLVQSRNDY